MAAIPIPERKKPALRGVSHLLATFAALVAGAFLIISASSSGTVGPAVIYAGGLVALFGVSAVYHTPMWSLPARARMRRLDHATIFVFIAATYTPICWVALGPENGKALLVAAWIAASVGVLKSLLWPGAPRWVTAGLYVAMGWLAITGFSTLPAALGPTGLLLLVSGGVLYTVGAVFYAVKWPEPLPGVFGHHEVFHALVIAAAVCHYVVVRGILT